jgi:phosphatidylglycerol---prolipoprotein diacylglyceryl transferase
VHPELFKLPDDLFKGVFLLSTLGGFSIAWYGVLITMGVMIGAVIATKVAERRGLNGNLLSDMVFWSVVWGVVGARVGYVLTSPSNFAYTSTDTALTWFGKVANIREGGLSIHGGVIFGIVVLIYYARRYKINFYQYIDLYAPGLALGIIGGRLGNFFNGADTIGRITTLPIGWTFPGWGEDILGIFKAERNWAGMPGLCKPASGEVSVSPLCQAGVEYLRGPVHLTQIYGVFIGVALLIAIFYWMRSRRPGWVFWNTILWYSLMRAGIEETFRLNSGGWKVYQNDDIGMFFFTTTQLFSIPLIIISLIMLQRIKNQPEQPWEEHVPNPDKPLISSAAVELPKT